MAPLAPTRHRWRSALAAMALVSLLACSSAVPSISTIIRWGVGPEHRGDRPPPGDRYLLVLPVAGVGGKAPPAEPKCFPASSFLPAPAPDPRIFFLYDGQVYVSRTKDGTPTLLPGNDRALGITRLLAFDKEASPLELLVAAKPQGAQAEQIWLLTLGAQGIQSAAQVTADRGLTSEEAFFDRYDAPRCLPGGRQCLVPSSDDESSYLDVEPIRGASPVPFRALGSVHIVDATWASSKGEAAYLLVPCSPKKDR